MAADPVFGMTMNGNLRNILL